MDDLDGVAAHTLPVLGDAIARDELVVLLPLAVNAPELAQLRVDFPFHGCLLEHEPVERARDFVAQDDRSADFAGIDILVPELQDELMECGNGTHPAVQLFLHC